MQGCKVPQFWEAAVKIIGMKKLKKILAFVVAAFMAIIYFAEEINGVVGNVQDALPVQFDLTNVGLPVLEGDNSSQVIAYTGHTLSYNSKTRLPNWVAYELTAQEAQGENPRKDKFAQDPQVRGPQGAKEDYRNSGWDRGHMAPAGDMKWSTQAMDETYYFTNICPQNHELNSGDWKELEEQCRRWAIKYGSLHVVCGPVVGGNAHGVLGPNKIVIPDKFFKVILIPKGGEYHGVGFIFDNPPRRKSKISSKPPVQRPLQSYAVTIDEVERIAGMDFFPLLPAELQEVVESTSALPSR